MSEARRAWAKVPKHVRDAILSHLREEGDIWFGQQRPYGEAMSEGYDAAIAVLEEAAGEERS